MKEKFEIKNGNLLYVKESKINENVDDIFEEISNYAEDLATEGENLQEICQDSSDPKEKKWQIESSLSEMQNDFTEIKSLMNDISVNESASVLTIGAGQGFGSGGSEGDVQPDQIKPLIKKLIRGLQKLHKGELKIDGKHIQSMFDKFSKSQELDPFFDDKAYAEEGTLKDRIEDMLDNMDKKTLREVARFIKGSLKKQ